MEKMNELEEPHTDEGRAEGHQGFVDRPIGVGSLAELTEGMQPSFGALDYPSVDSQAAAVRRAPWGDLRLDLPLAEFFPVRLRVVGPIRIQLLGLGGLVP